MKGKRTAALVVVGLAAILTARHWRTQREGPIYTTGSDVPDARFHGGPDFAMKRAAELLTVYRDGGWDLARVPKELQFLPDQKLAENPMNRPSTVTAWVFPVLQPQYHDIAFWTDLYARQNRTYYKGGKWEAHPSGYFIVAWKSGKIEKVPVEKLRLAQTPTDLITVFPGMPEYERGTPHVAYSQSP